MRALVISGGGSKGAFAGGVAQYLMEVEKRKYDIFVGTSTGGLLIPHLATDNLGKLHDIYTNVNSLSIFSLNPFIVRKKGDRKYVSINFFTTFLQFLKGKRTFGESKALRRPIQEAIRRGAKVVDAVILESENMDRNKVLGKNPFSLMLSIYGFVLDQIEFHDISEGILAAKHNGVELNLYYTPTKLTENSLVFNKKLMKQWWLQGFEYAQNKAYDSNRDK